MYNISVGCAAYNPTSIYTPKWSKYIVKLQQTRSADGRDAGCRRKKVYTIL